MNPIVTEADVIYAVVRTDRITTTSDIVRLTGIPRDVVERMVRFLETAELVFCDGYGFNTKIRFIEKKKLSR